MELGIRRLAAGQVHRTPSYIGSTDLRLEVIIPAGGAALDTQAGVLRGRRSTGIPCEAYSER
jgi:hypothetical protein